MKLIISVVILLITSQIKVKNMSEFIEFDLSELQIIDTNGVKVYYNELDDEIVFQQEKCVVDTFYNYSDFSQYLIVNELVDLDEINKINNNPFLGTVRAYRLHIEVLFHKNRLKDKVDHEFFLKKFNKLFDLKISNNYIFSDNDFIKINEKLNRTCSENTINEMSIYTLPTIIVVGEYLRKKHKVDWLYFNGQNLVGQEVITPYIELNKTPINIAQYIMKKYHHPEYYYGQKQLDFESYIQLDRILGGNEIKVKKQTPW